MPTPAIRNTRRSAHSTTRLQLKCRQLWSAQTSTVVTVHFTETRGLLPVVSCLYDLITGSADEVPPHDQLLLERLAAEEEDGGVGAGQEGSSRRSVPR